MTPVVNTKQCPACGHLLTMHRKSSGNRGIVCTAHSYGIADAGSPQPRSYQQGCPCRNYQVPTALQLVQWEYEILEPKEWTPLRKLLYDAGADGWRLCTIYDRRFWIMKRLLQGTLDPHAVLIYEFIVLQGSLKAVLNGIGRDGWELYAIEEQQLLCYREIH